MRYNICMALSWSGRRQLLYYGVGLVIVLVVGWAVYQSFFTAPPTCFDGKQDGTEEGVDCGGSCSLICSQDVRAPVVLWARSFEVSTSTYTAAAYIQNDNAGAAAHQVSYSFQLFDANNQLIVERDGSMDVPPISTVPVVETGINVGNRTPVRTLFAFASLPSWYRASSPPIQISKESLSADGSRLSATLTNGTLIELPQVAAAAVLFDASGTARAASKTRVSLSPGGSQQIIFTWPSGTPNVVRAEITVLPPFQ